MSPFGWGQRTCIGVGLTEDEVLLGCGGIAWGFNIGFKVDERTGEKIDVATDKSNSLLIIKPDKFEMAISPRSDERRMEIEEQWQDSKDMQMQ
jgi:hypothetical protein